MSDAPSPGEATVDGELDVSWNSYYGDGETVEVTGEENGEETTETWPEGATDPDDLNSLQRKVIRAAAMRPNQFESVRALSRTVAPDKDPTYANYVLSNHYPDGHEAIRNSKTDPTSGTTPPTQDADESGGTAADKSAPTTEWVPAEEVNLETLERFGIDYETRTLVRVEDDP